MQDVERGRGKIYVEHGDVVVIEKICRAVGVDGALAPVPPDDEHGWELVSVAICDPRVFQWWRRVESRDDRQRAVGEWALGTYGQGQWNPQTRAARVLEEALELAQSVDLPVEDMLRVVARVISRPKGEPRQEMGGLMVCLLAMAEQLGVSLVAAETEEWNRVRKVPVETLRERNAAKVKAGLP